MIKINLEICVNTNLNKYANLMSPWRHNQIQKSIFSLEPKTFILCIRLYRINWIFRFRLHNINLLLGSTLDTDSIPGDFVFSSNSKIFAKIFFSSYWKWKLSKRDGLGSIYSGWSTLNFILMCKSHSLDSGMCDQIEQDEQKFVFFETKIYSVEATR